MKDCVATKSMEESAAHCRKLSDVAGRPAT